MAIQSHIINGNDWTAISLVGQQGSCWLKRNPEVGRVYIHHSEIGSGSLDVDDGFPLYPASENNELLKISADSEFDIFYAKCNNVDAIAEIVVDLI